MMKVKAYAGTTLSWVASRWQALRQRRLVLLAAGVAILLFLAVGFRMAGSGAYEVKVLETGRVTRGNLERVLTATGIIKPEEGAEVKTGTRVTGVIETLHVKLGDEVVKGQTVAVMDKREQEAECRKLESELGALQMELALLNETQPLKMQEAVAGVSKARAEVEHAEVTYNRIEELAKTKSVAQAELDRESKDRITARQNKVVQETTRKKLATSYGLERARLEHSINVAAAELESALIRLSYATIVSPIDGVVSGITAQEGETVVAGLQVADLISVLDVSRLELRVYVDENDIGEVKLGDTVRFRVGAYPDRWFSGQVALIHPGPEIRNNIVYYRALVRLTPDTARALRPEMTAHCEMVVGEKKNALLVPNAAFKWVGPRRILLVTDSQGQPRPREAVTGLVGRTNTEVLEGLEEGEVVVTRAELPDILPRAWEPAP
ncbi:HlyD family secretion protein [Pseudodesulfovibrio alkaliphilus]|nr:efflux RND transporter periplasmic adaptor subunit [Pseudodesulfovibrio alkaliphilus]